MRRGERRRKSVGRADRRKPAYPDDGGKRAVDREATFRPGRSIGVCVGDPEQFVAAEQAALLRAAFLLTGSQDAAEDLVQETLIRVFVNWRRVSRADSPPAYVRRMLLSVFLRGRERSWHGEIPHGLLPELPGDAPYEAVDEQDAVRRALLTLPPRQRAAVVLRHYEDRSEADTASVMACSVGTVKSLTSRGLARLRDALSMPSHDITEGSAAP